MVQRIPLTDTHTGETAVVAEILGGGRAHRRLQALGIRPGAVVSKIRGSSAPGPLVVNVGGSQVSLGFGIAYKIVVEVERCSESCS